MNNFWVSPNSKLVECVITPSTSMTPSKSPFGTEKDLQNKKIVAVESFAGTDVINSPISTSNPITPLQIFNSSFVTFYRASVPAHDGFPAQVEGLYYDQIPLARLRTCINQLSNTAVPSGNNQMFRIVPTEFSWTKSYVTCAPSVAQATPVSALFLVHYLNEGADWRPYMP